MNDAFRDRALDGKVAFLAGATSGITLGIARHFARHGAKVALLGRNPQKLDAALASIADEGGTAIGFSADVRNFDRIDGAFAKTRAAFGNVDVVLSGAAGNFLAPALGMSANAFRAVVDIDLIGTFNVLRASFAYLKRPGASLIAISAPQGTVPRPFQAHACAAKAGVNMLTKCLALEWGPAGVRVNAISPGPIAGTEGMARLAPTPEAEVQIKSRLALRDYGTTRDIADAALFLASDNARYMTGAVVECDGGSALGDASADALSPAPRS